MGCCSEQVFERHSSPEIADIGQHQGVEYTIGRCKNCEAVLVHCWAGGVAGSTHVVSQELIDSWVAVPPMPRKRVLDEWFNSL